MKRLVGFLLLAGLFGVAAPVRAEILYGLTTTSSIVTFDSATPGTLTTNVALTGLAGETLVGIDFRPATGQLYGVGSGSGVFVIDPLTGIATRVAGLVDASNNPIALAGNAFGTDFNPVPDRLRITTSSGQNLRVNVATGVTVIDTGLAFNSLDVNAGGTPFVVGSGYINNVPGATGTTLYNIDARLDVLLTQIPPNAGTLNTVGSLGFDTSERVGFDVSGVTGTAYASLTPAAGGPSQLFTINLSTGAATLVGTIGDGNGVTLVGLSAAPVPEPASVALLALGLGAVVARRRRK